MSLIHGKKFVFIVSSGRTGTKAIAQHLSHCYPEVWARHEPSPSWRLRMGTTRELCGRITREELVGRLVKLRRGLVAGVGESVYVESNPYLAGFVGVLGEVFEEVRVVHVVRDARTYVRSGVNFGAFRGLKKLAAEWWPDWWPKPERCKSEFGFKWGEMDSIERLAWFWKLVNEKLNEGEGIYGARYLRITFEELFAGDGEGLLRLTDWMGLKRSSGIAEEARRERVNASRREVLPEWEKWCGGDQAKVMRHCEGLMRMYGYVKERAAVEVS